MLVKGRMTGKKTQVTPFKNHFAKLNSGHNGHDGRPHEENPTLMGDL